MYETADTTRALIVHSAKHGLYRSNCRHLQLAGVTGAGLASNKFPAIGLARVGIEGLVGSVRLSVGRCRFRCGRDEDEEEVKLLASLDLLVQLTIRPVSPLFPPLDPSYIELFVG